MALRARTILYSGVFAFGAGMVLWPPASELVYWDVFDPIVGEAVILLVLGASVAVGVGLGAFTPVGSRSFAVGGTIAYLLGMGAIGVVLTPDSPVHVLVYGSILIGLEIGILVTARGTGISATGTNVFST